MSYLFDIYDYLRSNSRVKIIDASSLCLLVLLSSLVLAPFTASSVYAQAGGSFFNPRDDDFILLGLKRVMDEYEIARSELDRDQALYEQSALSLNELNQSLRAYNRAEVDYQQNILKVIFEGQYVSVKNAIKYSNENGEKSVRITLENTSGGSAELGKLVNIDEDLFLSLEPDVINNVYISIMNDDDAIISRPYELKIDRLLSNQPVELTFDLLQDLDVVTINLVYSSGTQSSRKVFLEKDSTINRVEIQSDQFSQEVELGSSANYDLSLELFSGSNDTFKLEVLNLPNQINRYFTNPDTDARLSFIRYTESANTMQASLQVFLPDRPGQDFEIDASREFFVVAVPQDRVSELNLNSSRQWTEDEVEAMDVGYVKLDLVPRGIGELLVRARQLYFSIKADESIDVPIELVNEGTRRLDNVEIDVDLPLNWEHSIEPKSIDVLDISEETRSTITIIPTADVAVGRYEVRVTTTSLSDDQPIEGEDKTITIEIQADANVFGTAIILLLILLLVGGMVTFGVKLSRR